MSELERAGAARAASEETRHKTTAELYEEIRAAHRQGKGVTEIAREAGVSRQTVYNALERGQ